MHDELQGLAAALKEEKARVEAAESRLPQMEERARTAEAKAEHCEQTLSQIEQAIRTKLLKEGSSTHHRAAAA